MVKSNYDPIKSIPDRNVVLWSKAMDQYEKEREGGFFKNDHKWSDLDRSQKKEYFVGAEMELEREQQHRA